MPYALTDAPEHPAHTVFKILDLVRELLPIPLTPEQEIELLCQVGDIIEDSNL